MKRILGMTLGCAALMAASATAQELKFTPGLWEYKVRVERFGGRTDKPTSVDTRVDRICIVPGDEKSMQPLYSPDLGDQLKGKCWQSEAREEPGRKQVKMACENGVTAESVSRLEANGAIGSMIVLNDPKMGGLKVQGVSKKIAETCPPEALLPRPATPTPPEPPRKP